TPRSTLFPYTPLCRSALRSGGGQLRRCQAERQADQEPEDVGHALFSSRARAVAVAGGPAGAGCSGRPGQAVGWLSLAVSRAGQRSEEHTSELQSRENL